MIEECPDIVGLTADVVAAYVAHNSMPAGDLPKLIDLVHNALHMLVAAVPDEPEEPEPLVPAVSVKKSITPDYLISLENGMPYKSLKRHLTARGLTPGQYRHRWGLPSDYPMVAPNYAKRRSELAKGFGLGKMRSRVNATSPVS